MNDEWSTVLFFFVLFFYFYTEPWAHILVFYTHKHTHQIQRISLNMFYTLIYCVYIKNEKKKHFSLKFRLHSSPFQFCCRCLTFVFNVCFSYIKPHTYTHTHIVCLSYACRAQHHTYFVLVVNSRNKMWGNLFMCFKLETHLTFKRLFIASARAHTYRERQSEEFVVFSSSSLTSFSFQQHTCNKYYHMWWLVRLVSQFSLAICVCVFVRVFAWVWRVTEVFCPLILLFRIFIYIYLYVFVFGRYCCCPGCY